MPFLQVKIKDRAFAWTQSLKEDDVVQREAKSQAAKIFSGVIFGFSVLLVIAALFLLYLKGFSNLIIISAWLNASWHGLFFVLALYGVCVLIAIQVKTGLKQTGMPRVDGPEELGEPETAGDSVVNIAPLFSSEARETIEKGYSIAMKFGHAQLEPIHLFVATLESVDGSVMFGRLGLKFDQVIDPLGRRLETRQLGRPTQVGEQAERLLLLAFTNAIAEQLDHVPPLEILMACFHLDPFLQDLMLDLGISADQFENMAEWIRINERMRGQIKKFQQAAVYKPTGAMNRAMTSVATPILDAFSEDLTTAAVRGQLPMLVGREEEIEMIFRVIEGGLQSVVLVGPEGVGKTTLLGGIAQLMVEERVPKILQDKRLVRLSVPHLISGVSPAMAQERLLQLFYEVSKSRNIILAVTDIEQMTGITSGGESTADLASTFVDFLSRSGSFAISTTTPQAYAAAIERSILGRIFEKVEVNEPNETSAIQMLEAKIGGIEYQHKVVFTYEAVEKAVQLTDRFMHESYLPKKAINIAREAAQYVEKTRGADSLVTGDDVAQIVTTRTGVPTESINREEKDILLHLEERMHGRVIGQDEAVKAVAAALRRARAELRSNDRPIATFLFLGPTGVGKTELAKTVAQMYFGNEQAMIRLDMSEYQEQASIHRLIGVPGTKEGGLLTEAVRKQPFSIVLLDELEKAHSDILNIFLQVFDDGRLTDAAGRTIDFTNVIIVATSNAGTTYIQDAVKQGQSLEQIKTHLLEQELRGIYRPEFLNRFDGIIVFKPLEFEQVIQIAELMVQKVASRLEPKGIFFRAEPEAIKSLAQKGFDPIFGARPLRRVVQDEVDTAIADALLQGRVQRRDTIVLGIGGSIRIEKGEAL